MTIDISRRGALRLSASLLATTVVASLPAAAQGSRTRNGLIFSSSNSPDGNEVLVFARGESGAATPLTSLATGGLGNGGGLGAQGTVTLSGNGRYLFVTNVASNDVSTFALVGDRLLLRSVVPSGGLGPTSVTENDGRVWVLNAGGDGGVAGFRNERGVLVPMAGSMAALSAAGGTAPAQVGLSRDGELLVVSERNTNLLSSWPVHADGSLGARAGTASPGLTPFGFAFTRRDKLVVSEAAGGAAGASSASGYAVPRRSASAPRLVSAAVPTTQTAACWVAVTPDGAHAYTSNAGSSSLSSFAVGRDGSLSLLQAQAAVTGENTGALDAACSSDGRQLHVFASRGLFIASYAIGDDGSLSLLGNTAGLPAGSAGLAAT